MERFKNVLILAPHTDDGELGVGGTINKLINLGSKVTYVAFSIAEESVPDGFPKDVLMHEVAKATVKLGIRKENLIIFKFPVRKLNYHRQEILEKLIELRRKEKYDLILIPSLHDVHQDHSTIAEEGIRAFKQNNIWSYELLWNNFNFNTCSFVTLDEENVQSKVDALKEYKSQGFRDYMSEEFIYSHCRTRGVQIGVKFAEVFEVIRQIN